MLLSVKILCTIFLVKICIPHARAESFTIEEIVDRYSEKILKLYTDADNLMKNSYKRSNDQVQIVLQNNTQEFKKTKEFLPKMHNKMNQVLQDYGLRYLPANARDCQNEYDIKSENIGKYIKESENICLVFISKVFNLVENNELYKNLTEVKMAINNIKTECSQIADGNSALDCFRKDIEKCKGRVKELKREVDHYLSRVEIEASMMTDALHRCHDTVRKEVLTKKQNEAISKFHNCLHNYS